jgi:hypothetical protein
MKSSNNLFIRSLTYILLLAVLLCASVSYSLRTIDMNNFRTKQMQIITKQQRALDKQMKAHDDTIKAAQLKQQEVTAATSLSSASQKEGPKINKPAKPYSNNSAKLPTCDCYTKNNRYNYPSNFNYNAAGDRILRLYPRCKCTPQTSSAPIAPLTKTKSNFFNTENNAKKSGSASNWNIHY